MDCKAEHSEEHEAGKGLLAVWRMSSERAETGMSGGA